MTLKEQALIFTFLLAIILFVLVLINAIYFYIKHYKTIATQVDGTYIDVGFLLSANRLMLWAHYCIFPKRAKRAKVHDIFSSIPKTTRVQLLFHWFGILIGCLLFVVGGILNMQPTLL